MSSIGKLVKLTVWGESHGSMIGGVIDGVDTGIKIDYEKLRAHMKRRSPGKSNTTLRKESDEVEFVSGILNDTTTGAPLSFIIKNSDHHSKDYSNIYNTPRPSHADYPATVRYNGFNDINGSGHFSGRLTAVINVAGFIAQEILKEHDIYVFSHLYSLGDIVDERFDDLKFTDYSYLKNRKIEVINDEIIDKIDDKIEELRDRKDSVGSSVETVVYNLRAGVGDTLFDSIESRLSQSYFGIGAVKSVEFGLGKSFDKSNASVVNDCYYIETEQIKTKTNYNGGILGGISTGMPIISLVTFKPPASIGITQDTVDLRNKKNTTLTVEGRHDPSIGIRAVSVMESITAFVIYDLLKEYGWKNLEKK